VCCLRREASPASARVVAFKEGVSRGCLSLFDLVFELLPVVSSNERSLRPRILFVYTTLFLLQMIEYKEKEIAVPAGGELQSISGRVTTRIAVAGPFISST
jgi:hypothetical protein